MATVAVPPADASAAALTGEARIAEASRIISNSCGWSAAAGAIPLPVVDVVALGGVQATMINRIAKLYGETLTDEAARSLVAVLLGTMLPGALTSAAVGSGVKFLPGFGYVIGAATLAALGAAATYAMGKIFVRHFEHGGTMATFSPAAVQDDLQREFAAAKARAS